MPLPRNPSFSTTTQHRFHLRRSFSPASPSDGQSCRSSLPPLPNSATDGDVLSPALRHRDHHVVPARSLHHGCRLAVRIIMSPRDSVIPFALFFLAIPLITAQSVLPPLSPAASPPPCSDPNPNPLVSLCVSCLSKFSFHRAMCVRDGRA